MQEQSQELILDASKVLWHKERVAQWYRGERVAPITIDMALTQACQYSCSFCYAKLQRNKPHKITWQVMKDFVDDCAEMGVKAISLVSDGESTANPIYKDVIAYIKQNGIDVAMASNGYVLDSTNLGAILPHLTYLRFNFSGGEPQRYAEIMGVTPAHFTQVCENIKEAVRIKKERNLSVTLGMQMVLMPQDSDQIIPLAKLGRELGVDYVVIKHCSDDENGALGVDYSAYQKCFDKLHEAEGYSTKDYLVKAKWSKIKSGSGANRSYARCYAPPLHLQISGTGLVAPCGMLFNEKYKKFHIGNITQTRFKDIVAGERYWEVMHLLASPEFDARSMCGSLCLQHKSNEVLDKLKKGEIELESASPVGNARVASGVKSSLDSRVDLKVGVGADSRAGVGVNANADLRADSSAGFTPPPPPQHLNFI